MPAQEQRLLFIDIMRGLAVVTMVMGHTIDSVLDVGIRSTEWFRIYNFFRGFTAPVFLFVSGLAFSVATEKRWKEYLRFGPHLQARARRIALLLFIGYSLHMPFFSLEKLISGATSADIGRWLQVDVLHCVAGTMIILHGLIFIARSQKVFAAATLAGLGLIIFSTPLIWSHNFEPVLSQVISPYMNQNQASIFPIFPFAAFMFAGVATGHYYQRAQARNAEKEFFSRLVIGGGLVAAACVAVDLLPFSLYPFHDFWKTSPIFFLFRISMVVLLTGSFFLAVKIPTLLERHLTLLGRSSLLVYTVHIMLVYGSVLNLGLMQVVGQMLPWNLAVGIGLCVLTLMLLIAIGWSHLRSQHFVPSRFAQAAIAGTLFFLFLVSPY